MHGYVKNVVVTRYFHTTSVQSYVGTLQTKFFQIIAFGSRAYTLSIAVQIGSGTCGVSSTQ